MKTYLKNANQDSKLPSSNLTRLISSQQVVEIHCLALNIFHPHSENSKLLCNICIWTPFLQILPTRSDCRPRPPVCDFEVGEQVQILRRKIDSRWLVNRLQKHVIEGIQQILQIQLAASLKLRKHSWSVALHESISNTASADLGRPALVKRSRLGKLQNGVLCSLALPLGVGHPSNEARKKSYNPGTQCRGNCGVDRPCFPFWNALFPKPPAITKRSKKFHLLAPLLIGRHFAMGARKPLAARPQGVK